VRSQAKTPARAIDPPWALPARTAAAILLGAVVFAAGGQSDLAPAAKAAPELPPFMPGETLRYKVDWDPPWFLFFLPKMEAGHLELALQEGPSYEGKPAWRVTFKANSSGTLARLTGLKVEDVFESLADPETLCTYRVSKKIREGKRKRDIEVRYEPEKGRLHIRETDVGKSPPHATKDRFKQNIPACVRDLFAALYALRRERLQPGASRRWVLGDDDVVKEVETRVLRKETVMAPAGPTSSLHVETVSLLGGLFKDGGEFRIWLSDDQRRLPLKFEVQVKLGKVDGRLLTVKP
jgi:hypothetical protein